MTKFTHTALESDPRSLVARRPGTYSVVARIVVVCGPAAGNVFGRRVDCECLSAVLRGSVCVGGEGAMEVGANGAAVQPECSHAGEIGQGEPVGLALEICLCRSDARAMSTGGDDMPLGLQLAIGTSNRVGRESQLDGEPTYGWQLATRWQGTLPDVLEDLAPKLFVRWHPAGRVDAKHDCSPGPWLGPEAEVGARPQLLQHPICGLAHDHDHG